jgi:plastocyanin
MRKLSTPLAILAVLAALAACSSSTSPSGGGAAGQVTVGDPSFFKSNHNGTQNPAVDTVAVGTTVTWTWVNTGAVSHSVESDPANPGDPSFTSSAIQMGNGKTYSFKFTTPGSYDYDCAVHGSAMTGTIVVE